MDQKNFNLEQIRSLLATLQSEITSVRDKYEKALSKYGEKHPNTVAARSQLDNLLSELKNFLFWLDKID